MVGVILLYTLSSDKISGSYLLFSLLVIPRQCRTLATPSFYCLLETDGDRKTFA
jgi:hypothetical protein